MGDTTVNVTCNNQLSAIAPGVTSSLMDELLYRRLGDPVESVVGVSVRSPSVAPRLEATAEAYTPRTELGRKLWEIRKRAVLAGEAPVSWETLERELAELRREPEDRWE